MHAVPLGLAGFEHTPVVVLQAPAVWHWSWAVQVTGLLPLHAPAWQVSLWVHALPSLHAAPSALAGLEQRPVEGLHEPTPWH